MGCVLGGIALIVALNPNSGNHSLWGDLRLRKLTGFRWTFSTADFEDGANRLLLEVIKLCFTSLMLGSPGRCVSIWFTSKFSTDLEGKLLCALKWP